MTKYAILETAARKGIEKLYIDIQMSENIEEMRSHLNQLLELVYRYAAKKNNRHNKSLKVFAEYSKLTTREDKVKQEIFKKHTKKKKTYKDYISTFELLRERGYSYRKIAEYANKELKIKVSSETIRKALSLRNEMIPSEGVKNEFQR